MSVQAIGWVMDHSASRLGARLVLLSIANHAHADGTGAYPSKATIAREAGLSPRQVQRLIHELELLGELWVWRGAGPKGAHLFIIRPLAEGGDNMTPPDAEAEGRQKDGGGDKSDPEGETPMSPEPRTEPSLEPRSIVARHFDAFWEVYPRKAGKRAAWLAYQRAHQRGADLETIFDGAVRFREDPNRDPSFTPHPSTWLNQERWTDDPLPTRSGQASGRGGRVREIMARAESRR